MVIDILASAAVGLALVAGWALYRPFYPFLGRGRTTLAALLGLFVLVSLPPKTSGGFAPFTPSPALAVSSVQTTAATAPAQAPMATPRPAPRPHLAAPSVRGEDQAVMGG